MNKRKTIVPAVLVLTICLQILCALKKTKAGNAW